MKAVANYKRESNCNTNLKLSEMQKFLISLTLALLCGYLSFIGIYKQGSESNLETVELKTMPDVLGSCEEIQLETEFLEYAVKKLVLGWSDVSHSYFYLTLQVETSSAVSPYLTGLQKYNELQSVINLIIFKKERAYYDFSNPKIRKEDGSNGLALAARLPYNFLSLPDIDLCPLARARSPGNITRL